MRKELWEFTGGRIQIWLRPSRRESRRKWLGEEPRRMTSMGMHYNCNN